MIVIKNFHFSVCKWLLAILVILLVGCNSEGVFDGVDNQITSIQIIPIEAKVQGSTLLKVIVGGSQEFAAIATYDDGSTKNITELATWISSNNDVAKLDKGGLALGINTGYTDISATHLGIDSPAIPLEVTDAEITRIQLVAGATIFGNTEMTLPKGNQLKLIALGQYSDGVSQDITDKVTLTSDLSPAVTISRDGVVTGLDVGVADIQVGKNGVLSNNVKIEVTNAKLESIEVSLNTRTTKGVSEFSLALGNTQQLQALGLYNDGTKSDLTELVYWDSDAHNIASIDDSGLVTALSVNTAKINATYESISSNVIKVNVTPEELFAIQIEPKNTIRGNSDFLLPKGLTHEFVATGYYTNNTTAEVTSLVNWSSSDRQTFTVDTDGLITANDVGFAVLGASLKGVDSNDVDIEVTAAAIDSIQVTPATISLAKGTKEQLTAVASFTDGTTQNVSSIVAWSPDDSNIATISRDGLVTATGVGTTFASAMLNGVISNTVNIDVTTAVVASIQVSPETISLAKGTTEQLQAKATFTDGTSQDVTQLVAWFTDDTDVVFITSDGLVEAKGIGRTTATAMLDGVTSNNVSIDVTAATVDTVQVSPAIVSFAKGTKFSLIAEATFTDGSIQDVSSTAAWVSDDINIATINTDGLLTAQNIGATTATASFDGRISNGVDIHVTAALIDSIDVNPGTVFLAKGFNEQLEAVATFTDGTNQNITDLVAWLSDDTDIATITLDGLLTAENVGLTTVTAELDGVISNTVDVEIINATLLTLQLSSLVDDRLPKGTTEQLVVKGIYSDQSEHILSDQVNWHSSDNSLLSIDVDGIAEGVEFGDVIVYADLDGVSSNIIDVNISSIIPMCGGKVNDNEDNAGGHCVKVASDDSGRLFTATPSSSLLYSLGYTRNRGESPNGAENPRFFTGVLGGTFYSSATFELLPSQEYPEKNKASYWCEDLSFHKFEGRDDWRLTTTSEFVNFLNYIGDDVEVFKWNNGSYYLGQSGAFTWDKISAGGSNAGMVLPVLSTSEEGSVSCTFDP